MRNLNKVRLSAAALTSAFLVAGCASADGPPRRLELTATLTGYQALPGPGDLDGTGTARLEVDREAGRVCWVLTARGIAPATAAHLHRGDAGNVGAELAALAAPGADERSEGCASIAAPLALELMARPHAFYVDVHNAAFPGGAIRGQLRGQVRRPEARPSPSGARR